MTEKNQSARVTGVQASPEVVPSAEPTPALKPETLANVDLRVDTQPKSVVNSAPQAKTLGRYMILSELGRGGMGAVYLADDSVLKRKVALKIPQFEPEKAEQMQARFLREAQLAAQLSHPNICQIHDVGVIDGQYVMAMEYIEGKTLAAFAKPGKLLSERQVVSLVKKVALAVEAAHHQGMIHRDLKPGNIMLPKPTPTRKTIEPKVMDFGLAKSLDARTTELTKSGMIVGTPCYMSKEQWSGKDAQLGPPCDVYSLGVILYELLTGSLPYDVEDGEPATSWFVKLVTEPQRRPSERKPDIDAGLDAIVMKAIAKEPADRFATMADFAATLEAWLKGKPVTGQTLLGIQLGALPVVLPARQPKPNPGNGWRGIVKRPLVMWGGLGGAGLVLLLGIGLWFKFKWNNGDPVVSGGVTGQFDPPKSVKGASAESPKQATISEEPKQRFDEACKTARALLLAAFDKKLVEIRELDSLSEDTNQTRTTALEEEKATFASHGTVPFSSTMRSATIAYVQRLEGAQKLGVMSCDQLIASLEDSEEPKALETIRELNETKISCFTPQLVATWQFTSQNSGASSDIRLRSDWSFDRDHGSLPGTWTLTETQLILRSPASTAPGGAWIDTLFISDDGRSYTGTNQGGARFSGTLKVADDKKQAKDRSEQDEIDALTDALLGHTWYYRDSLFPPGETFKFNANGTFHYWKWNYWVIGSREMRIHYDRNNKDADTGIPFTFNEDLTEFSGEFTDGKGKTHIITGKRQ